MAKLNANLTLGVLVLCLCGLFAHASDKVYPAYQLPMNSPFSIKQIKETPPFLYFSGEISLRVKFRFDYVAWADPGFIELSLEPLANSVNVLPFLVERGREERPYLISVSNAQEAATLLLEKPLQQALLTGKQPSVIGEAEVSISQFGAGYECDQAVFIAEITLLLRQFQTPIAVDSRQQPGC